MKLSEKQELWILELEDLWNFFEARLKSYKLKTHDFRLIVLLNMTLAVHRLIRGFMAQLKGGSNDGLQSYLRTLTEATININYILSDETDNNAKAFILDSKRSRIKARVRIINLLEQDRAPSMARINSIESYKKLKLRLEQEVSEQESRLGVNNINWPRSLSEFLDPLYTSHSASLLNTLCGLGKTRISCINFRPHRRA